MTLFEAIILGTIQGLTEFLPISSSGHLVLGQMILDVKIQGNEFEVVTHLGTLVSVLCIFWKEILSLILNITDKNTREYIFYIILGTIPAAIIGFGAKSYISELFDSVQLVSVALMVTGLILFFSQKVKKNSLTIDANKALLIGITQAIAIIPGISRSGITICTALALGMSGKNAAKFSFLLAIPVISGAGLLLAFNSQSNITLIPLTSLIMAFLSSFIVGYICLKWLLSLLESGKFYFFGYYCFLIGLIVFLFF
jgi:undecaprenyl-diphosphatase